MTASFDKSIWDRWRNIFYAYSSKHKKKKDACTDSGTVKMSIRDKEHLCLEEKQAVVACWPQSWEQTMKNQNKRLKPPVQGIILLQSSLNPPLWWISLSDPPFLKLGLSFRGLLHQQAGIRIEGKEIMEENKRRWQQLHGWVQNT